ncbi:ribosomal protection-like ABC-F family protein [Rossellomorea aquimaris]|uniref:ribosomal protection-like ABC-F family protein n=1 Tax=Rossellomorea aquimaris TaxID=189382 RepID=UPI0007D093E6|nr:ATP-binding cassette domain-containing protein [Rossellomorea aquimaris]
MLYMKAKNIHFSIGEKTFFSLPQLSIYKGEKIGLIGRNGQGKSLLIKTLLGINSNKTEVEWYGTTGYFEQLSSESDFIEPLSGGEKTTRKLNEVFAHNPDILFLDEPSNNLDWSKVEDLKVRLKNWSGACIIASHDRSLLDGVCTKIWELSHGEFKEYEGNYTDYLKAKEREKVSQEEKYEEYTKEKKRLMERYRKKVQQSQNMNKPPSRMGTSESSLYKGKAAGKKGKIERVSNVIRERVERLEKVEKPFEWEKVKMEYTVQSPVHRKQLLIAKDIEKTFHQKRLYSISQLKLKTGSKTACIGENGSGKTSLIRQLLEEKDDRVDISKSVKVGYFDQQLSNLPLDKTILEFIMNGSTLPQHVIRIILARLRFYEEDVHKKINHLSGGERVKVAIGKLLVGDFNLLVLDEPTNHVDLDTLEALEGLLIDYPGTILLVSHDKRFIENVANKLWIIKDNQVEMFDGSLRDWEQSNSHTLPKSHNNDEQLMLENKLVELISRLSFPEEEKDMDGLEEEYTRVLKRLNLIRQSLKKEKTGK